MRIYDAEDYRDMVAKASQQTLGELFDAVEEGDDELMALASLGPLRRAHQEWLEETEARLVRRARMGYVSWDDIGILLGRSRQAVWKKHAGSDP